MTISISSDVLLSYLQVRSGQTGSSTAAAASASLAAKAPTAPWNAAATSTSTSSLTNAALTAASNSTTALVEQVLSGTSIVDPSAAKLSQTTSSMAANSDYQNLFALYQGLTTLQSLTTAAAATSTTTAQLALIQKAFTSGLNQVRSFVAGGPFKEFAVSDGTVSTSDTTTVGAQQSSDTYDTGALVKVSANDLVPAFQGEVAFSLTATNLQGQATTVNFNLDDLGSTPRTLSNVTSYLNGQLAAAGVKTRFADNLIPGTPAVTTTSNGVTTTVTAATPDQYGLQINGTPNELLSFSAAASTPAVYIAQTSYDPAATSTTSTTTTTTTSTTTTATSGTSSTAATTTSQFIKLDQPDAAGDPTIRGFTDALPTGSIVKATATAPDGSVYVLADVSSTTGGQTLQGAQDAALFKYDSAGQLEYTRTLGAASTVNASALAVSSDGSQVAIAGSVTGGAVDPTDTSEDGSTLAQSFVSVYDAAGDQLWNHTEDGTDDNQVNAVSFGTNNSVYVAGSTSAHLPGAGASAGGQDGYLQGFSVTASTDKLTKDVTYSATSAFTQQFGTSGVDRATGVAVSGGAVYVSSVENGDAVVRRYDVSATTTSKTVNLGVGGSTSTTTQLAASFGARQDLGALVGGNVSGIAVAADGSVLVAGSTHNAALNAGTVTSAYSGNGDAFVASLDANLDPSGSESLAYYNGGAPTTASALTVSGNAAYITGQLAGASLTTPSTGYAAALDPTSGQVSWSTTFTGNNGSAVPSSIAVSNTGASVLDRLGLPQGPLAIQAQPSQLLVANSSVQVGDKFYVQGGAGVAQPVTIEADDTYSTLAQKIRVASGYNATVTTTTYDGEQQLRITPANASTSVTIQAGPGGQDALGSLGLKEGLISSTASAAAPTTLNGVKVTSNIKSHYSVTVPASLSLATTAQVTAAQTSLATAIADVKSIYADLTTAKTTGAGASTTGTVPSYITAQIANYKLALSRLSGSSSSSGSTSTALSILGG